MKRKRERVDEEESDHSSNCGGAGAQASSADDLDRYKCPICLDLCDGVVESPCGHLLFCKACVQPLRQTHPGRLVGCYISSPTCRSRSIWQRGATLPDGWHPWPFQWSPPTVLRLPQVPRYSCTGTTLHLIDTHAMRASQPRSCGPLRPARDVARGSAQLLNLVQLYCGERAG